MSALDPPRLAALGQVLEATADRELDCEEYLARLPELAERRAAGQPMPESLRLAEAHERLCANCREETAALLQALLSAED
jgi:hypothetical protein